MTINKVKDVMSFRELTIYKKPFGMTRQFPKEETYSLIDQIRELSRSVCSTIGKVEDLKTNFEEVGRLLNHMIANPEKYLPKGAKKII